MGKYQNIIPEFQNKSFNTMKLSDIYNLIDTTNTAYTNFNNNYIPKIVMFNS